MTRRPMADIRNELDWLEIEAGVFAGDLEEEVRIENRRREVIACLYRFGLVEEPSKGAEA